MKKKWSSPTVSVFQCDIRKLEGLVNADDAEWKEKLEKVGYLFSKTFQTKDTYVYRKIAGGDVLISIGENIANFNGYVELNKSAALLWRAMQEPLTVGELEKLLEKHFEIPHQQAVRDVLEFLKVLQENNMLLVR